MLIVSFSSLVSICTWLYLIYPSIKKREQDINKALDEEANSKFLLGEDDKVLLSARIDNDLTAKEQDYVDNLLENSAQARKYLQTLMLVDQKTREFFRLDCPYCGKNKNEGYHTSVGLDKNPRSASPSARSAVSQHVRV